MSLRSAERDFVSAAAFDREFSIKQIKRITEWKKAGKPRKR